MAQSEIMPDLPPSLDPYDPRVSVRRRFLLMVAGGMVTILMLACCICGGAMFYFRPRIEQNPEKAVALTKQILRTTRAGSGSTFATPCWNEVEPKNH